MLSNSKKILRVKIGEKKVVILFDDGDKLEISPNVYTEYNFFAGKQLSKKDINSIKNRNDLDKYISYAVNLASKKNYSKHQLKEKLTKKGASEAQIEQVIEMLIKYQLLDEKLLIKEFLEYADYKHFGYNKIKEELFKKGISSIYIEKIKYDEARELKHSKILLKDYERKYSKYNYALKKKHIYEALIRQGYSYDIASSTLEYMSPIDEKHERECLKLDYQKAKNKYKDKYGPYECKDKITEYLIQKGYRYTDIKNIKE